MTDFVVLDTEGKDVLTEIAIVNSQGDLCYEAFCKTENQRFNDPSIPFRLNYKPLTEIVQTVEDLCRDKIIVCHNAQHDTNVLRRSFEQAGRVWPDFQFVCSCNLAQERLPGMASYSLEFLCKSLDLRVGGQRFNRQQAHRARYDATFTYKLYCYLSNPPHSSKPQPSMPAAILAEKYKNTPNPFRSNRVDNPFQHHPDCQAIYAQQFNTLKVALNDVRLDAGNHQSQGVVVIGEPGSGKTHLMMRLAHEVLITNRLFFIRHPNNAKAVQYHIYARMLESFAEKISQDSSHTQLEQLLAQSFVNILKQTDFTKTQKGRGILEALGNDSLSLYQRLGKPGSDVNRSNWNAIERQILQWWGSQDNHASYGTTILRGIIRFCRYAEPYYKTLIMRWLAGHSEADSDDLKKVGLQPWLDEFSQEEFALEAMKTFGQLALLDQPLIFVFDQLESLGSKHNQELLESFGNSVKELLTQVPNSLVILNLFPDRWQQFQKVFDVSVVGRLQTTVTLELPQREQLISLLKMLCISDLSVKEPGFSLNLDELLTAQELEEVLGQSSLRSVITRASDYFRWKVQGIPLPSPPVRSSSPELKEWTQWKDELSRAYQSFGEILQKMPLPLINNGEKTGITGTGVKPPLPKNLLDQHWANIKEDWQRQKYDTPRILSDTDDLGKLMKIVEAFSQCKTLTVEQLSYGKRVLPEHICVSTATQSTALGFLESTGSAFTSRIKNFNQLVLKNKNTRFRLMRDVQHPEVKRGSVAHDEMLRLQAADNGDYVPMDRDDRITFECLHQLITDFENRDLTFETSIPEIVDWMTAKLPDYWIIRACTR